MTLSSWSPSRRGPRRGSAAEHPGRASTSSEASLPSAAREQRSASSRVTTIRWKRKEEDISLLKVMEASPDIASLVYPGRAAGHPLDRTFGGGAGLQAADERRAIKQ